MWKSILLFSISCQFIYIRRSLTVTQKCGETSFSEVWIPMESMVHLFLVKGNQTCLLAIKICRRFVIMFNLHRDDNIIHRKYYRFATSFMFTAIPSYFNRIWYVLEKLVTFENYNTGSSRSLWENRSWKNKCLLKLMKGHHLLCN